MDSVNHPEHYNLGDIEVIDAIDDWKLDFCLGNAVKYIARADNKNHPIEDLRKAIWYIQHRIELLQKANPLMARTPVKILDEKTLDELKNVEYHCGVP